MALVAPEYLYFRPVASSIRKIASLSTATPSAGSMLGFTAYLTVWHGL